MSFKKNRKHFIQNMKEHNYRPKMISKQGQNGTLATKLNPSLLCINIVNRNLNTQYVHVAILKYSYNYESGLIFLKFDCGQSI